MADKKVTQLTALASPNDEDLLLLVDDPNGTPVSKKIDVKTFVGNIPSNTAIRSLVAIQCSHLMLSLLALCDHQVLS